jgi:hypothetical protein
VKRFVRKAYKRDESQIKFAVVSYLKDVNLFFKTKSIRLKISVIAA